VHLEGGVQRARHLVWLADENPRKMKKARRIGFDAREGGDGLDIYRETNLDVLMQLCQLRTGISASPARRHMPLRVCLRLASPCCHVDTDDDGMGVMFGLPRCIAYRVGCNGQHVETCGGQFKLSTGRPPTWRSRSQRLEFDRLCHRMPACTKQLNLSGTAHSRLKLKPGHVGPGKNNGLG
jgi:hypothetical protein